MAPPIEPMLARVAEEIPPQGGFLYEPKWDGFRAIVFRGKDDVFIQSRDLRPFDRYFPDLHALFLERLPAAECSYEQLEVTKPYELNKVFGLARSRI